MKSVLRDLNDRNVFAGGTGGDPRGLDRSIYVYQQEILQNIIDGQAMRREMHRAAVEVSELGSFLHRKAVVTRCTANVGDIRSIAEEVNKY